MKNMKESSLIVTFLILDNIYSHHVVWKATSQPDNKITDKSI